MFDKMKDMMGNMAMMQRMMQDANFRAFVSHSKVQQLFQDPEFKEVAKSRDFAKISAHPKFLELGRDPEVAALMLKINPQSFMKP